MNWLKLVKAIGITIGALALALVIAFTVGTTFIYSPWLGLAIITVVVDTIVISMVYQTIDD